MIFDIVRKSVLFVFVCGLLLTAFVAGGSAQCGVYLKPTSTKKFPYPNIFLDGAPDINGDGKADLFLSQNLGTGVFTRNRIFFVLGNGDGTFAYDTPIIVDPPAGTTFSTNFFKFVVFGPINNDANLDFIAATSAGLRGYINNGNNTFTSIALTGESSTGSLVDFFDLNGDGKGDYFGFGDGYRYALGNGDGTFGTPVTLSTTGGIGYRGDFNGDGKPDLINTQTLWTNNGNGTFTASDSSALFLNGEDIWGVADMNGDNKSDMLVAPSANVPSFSILISTGTGFTRVNYTVTTDPDSAGYPMLGNFSGNAAPDVIYNYATKNKKAVFTNDGTGTLTNQEYPQKFVFNPTFLRPAYADFDGDGKVDVMQATSKTDNYVVMFTDVTSFTFKKNTCNRVGQPRTVDFAGDGGTASYSYWNPATGDSVSLRNTVNWGLGSLGDIFVPGDFDGDGITDRAVYRDSTGYWYIRRSSDLAWFVLKFGLPGDKPVAADFDGDTITDIAVWRPSDGNWYFWYMGTQSFSAVHFGASGDKPVQSDYDGDGKADAAVYRPSTGVWYYLRSSDLNYGAVAWGNSTDRPIPGDFDGDGKTDTAIYRDSDHTAYILRSYDMTPVYYTFGITGDIPQVSDYDGDLVSELVIYRPSNKTWWSTRSQFSLTFGDVNVVPTASIIRVE